MMNLIGISLLPVCLFVCQDKGGDKAELHIKYSGPQFFGAQKINFEVNSTLRCETFIISFFCLFSKQLR